MNAVQLIRILQFADSVLPVGAFAFSNGVESAIQAGIVRDADTLQSFTRTALQQAAGGDGRAVTAACRALQAGDREAAMGYDWALFNRKLNEEGRNMVVRMGKKLAEMAAAICDEPQVVWWLEQIKTGRAAGTYPVTQAVVMTALGAGPREVVVMHQYGVAMTILSAAMRLMRVTHIDTQRILFQLNRDIDVFCDEAERGGVEQMASYAPVTDVLAALHVGAFTRLFSN
ncbi:TPA: urease accessory protein UreF [Serratia marcescens]|jgi:Urease accessory protein UreF|uniref:urease accessory protein UreF n=1 Tax=Serratia nevei TaxID=2703794 RepID=UPI00114E9619|nr:urease accessory protein UreF [Serratia marcescens]